MRDSFPDENMTDSDILAVLQCCDHNVEQTITALLEGSLSVATIYCCGFYV